MEKKLTVFDIKAKKQKEKITMLTAYEYSMAKIMDRSDIDIILVGDSLGMVMLGYRSTKKVTLNQMLHHTKAVSKAVKKSLVVSDMPFLSYNISLEETLHNASLLIKEADCDAVKIEGGHETCDSVKALCKAGIPVMGHIGLTPQTASLLGGYKVQGKDTEKAVYLIESAKSLQQAGCFALVLECIPSELSEIITSSIDIPTIGIGAGNACDGQVLVSYDLLGMFDGFKPKFVKQYDNLSLKMENSFKQYSEDVKKNLFPDKSYSYSMDGAALDQIKNIIKKGLK